MELIYDKGKLITEGCDFPFLMGSNTGLLALRIAYAMKCDPIYLLGIDLCFTPEKIHWHDGYKEISRKPKQDRYNIFIEDWRKTIDAIGDSRKVISCSAISVLNDVLPYKSLWSVLYDGY